MPKKDEEMSVSSEAKGPLKSFQALMGEGEKFSRDKLYIKAIQCYTEVSEPSVVKVIDRLFSFANLGTRSDSTRR